MTTYRLNTHVHVVERPGPDSQGRTGMFGPEDRLSDWAVAAISNPDVWDGQAPPQAPEPEPAPAAVDQSAELARLRQRIAELESARPDADSDTGPGQPVEAPPRGGPGSGAPEWRAYARSLDVQVADDATREDVINALEAAGKPTK